MDQLDRVHERIAGRFMRAEPRIRAREWVSGLVAGLGRKNGWTLTEQAGEVSPEGMQRLLRLWLEACDAAQVPATKVNDTLVTTSGREARADELGAGRRAGRR
jgi:hypothetical protein